MPNEATAAAAGEAFEALVRDGHDRAALALGFMSVALDEMRCANGGDLSAGLRAFAKSFDQRRMQTPWASD